LYTKVSCKLNVLNQVLPKPKLFTKIIGNILRPLVYFIPTFCHCTNQVQQQNVETK